MKQVIKFVTIVGESGAGGVANVKLIPSHRVPRLGEDAHVYACFPITSLALDGILSLHGSMTKLEMGELLDPVIDAASYLFGISNLNAQTPYINKQLDIVWCVDDMEVHVHNGVVTKIENHDITIGDCLEFVDNLAAYTRNSTTLLPAVYHSQN